MSMFRKASGMSSRHCHEYQSLGQRFTGSEEKDLLVIIENFGPSTLQVLLVNKFYGRQCKKLFKQLSVIVMAVAFDLLILENLILWQIVLLNGIILLWLLGTLIAFRKLVKQGNHSVHNNHNNCNYTSQGRYCMHSSATFPENFLYCENLGIHIQSKGIFGTKNYFIASSHIYDIVINEVCENVRH